MPRTRYTGTLTISCAYGAVSLSSSSCEVPWRIFGNGTFISVVIQQLGKNEYLNVLFELL